MTSLEPEESAWWSDWWNPPSHTKRQADELSKVNSTAPTTQILWAYSEKAAVFKGESAHLPWLFYQKFQFYRWLKQKACWNKMRGVRMWLDVAPKLVWKQSTSASARRRDTLGCSCSVLKLIRNLLSLLVHHKNLTRHGGTSTHTLTTRRTL